MRALIGKSIKFLTLMFPNVLGLMLFNELLDLRVPFFTRMWTYKSVVFDIDCCLIVHGYFKFSNV